MARKKKPQGGRTGLGGVRVVSAHGDEYWNNRYLSSEPKQYKPPSMMVAPHTANTEAPAVDAPAPTKEDPAIEAANKNDLKETEHQMNQEKIDNNAKARGITMSTAMLPDLNQKQHKSTTYPFSTAAASDLDDQPNVTLLKAAWRQYRDGHSSCTD